MRCHASHFIAGRWLDGTGERMVQLLDPATDEPVSQLTAATAAEVDEAVRAASSAAREWRRTPPAERAAMLASGAQRVAAAEQELTMLTVREMGRPLELAKSGVAAGVAAMTQYVELGPVHRGRSLQGEWGAIDMMVHEPRGVSAVLTPWNDPVAVPAGLLAAALVSGNTVVFKPSERTPRTGERLARALIDELPDGVLNLLQGDGRTGASIAGHPGVNVVVHVGSTSAGREIAAGAVRTGAKVVLENGGNDGLIIDAGVDAEWAAAQAALGGFINSGQLCTSVERVFVHETLVSEFLDALVKEAEALVLGAGEDPSTTLGPLVDRRARHGVHEQVQQALEAGAVVRTGGLVPQGRGSFYPATVLGDVHPDMTVMTEETFGPVVPVMAVESFEAGIAAAAMSAYGLAATVLTGSMLHAQEAWRRLPVGTVKINAVFGGAPGGAAHPRQASGDGFGYGPELLDELTVTKVVHLGQPQMAGAS